ncbi:hypothetical protein DPMN_174319 [Dreissena polymorpha]|uniref:Uncharacterized protein n=1 Tax=Dreissena polymorpha TaxID=45954 RepID=A0A9D4IF15_DREPO|nr:hypothetical protein DPMN_174319 [Dreissena polymorpha]
MHMPQARYSQVEAYMIPADNAEKDEAVTKAYESVLILSLSKLQGPIYEEFAAEVKKRALASYDITIESVSAVLSHLITDSCLITTVITLSF